MLVDDLLGKPELALETRVRGNTQRPIRWVHTIEVRAPGRFLRGGEVVLTAGVWRAAGVTARDFVADLVEADVAAVGFGPVPPELQVPDEFVDAAREHGLTCFVVPVDVAFLQVVEAFVSTKRAEWERPLRRHLGQHDAIVAALRVQRGVDTVLRTLSGQLGLPVAVRVDGGLVEGEEPRPQYPLPLVGEGLAEAELLLPRPLEELDVEQQAAVVQAMPFIALEIERNRAVRATELRYAWELFEWVHTGAVGPETVRTRLHSLGLPPDGPLAAVVVRSANPDVDAVRLGELLGSDGVAVQRGGEAVAFARVRDTTAALARRVHEALGAHIGAGKPGTAGDLRVSLLQASHAAEAVSGRSDGGWMTHEQLSSPSLLLSAQDPELLVSTSRALLGPVLDHDERRGGDLLPSLWVFLDAGCRWQESAQRLHVHINTLRHRMSRVEELTGRSLSSTADRVDLFLALRALRQS
ncbi:PucR family transcriptional regulator ligand-binding domain-containing protein [Saccharopolyspora erythraea]|uniref:PucR family transcriptional regulator n=1 Tax=Saccharopolyspora erythraea TaxID=1836 RepID=UPI001BAD0125|nr:PucR family transcriptional regulator [Saccharopolyspora erythraea]QUH04477.1 PucR family transcriptional regulator ligand-binding domain-containing protein [Saccharopolyspora erythraea]